MQYCASSLMLYNARSSQNCRACHIQGRVAAISRILPRSQLPRRETEQLGEDILLYEQDKENAGPPFLIQHCATDGGISDWAIVQCVMDQNRGIKPLMYRQVWRTTFVTCFSYRLSQGLDCQCPFVDKDYDSSSHDHFKALLSSPQGGCSSVCTWRLHDGRQYSWSLGFVGEVTVKVAKNDFRLLMDAPPICWGHEHCSRQYCKDTWVRWTIF